MNKALIEALVNANNANSLVDSASLTYPKSWIEAMDIQEKVLVEMGETIGAWKVGIGETPEGVMSAPLKKRSFRQGRFIEQDLPALGVQGFEVEVAFFISPEGQIKYMAPAIEWVQSRFLGWPNVKAEFQWADSLNHGGLWVGLPLVINEDLDWMNLEIMVQQDNQRKSVIKGQNPAGDPRGILAGFIRQSKNRRSSSDVSGWVTTGSYVGLLPVEVNPTIPILLEVTIQGVGSIEGKINWLK